MKLHTFVKRPPACKGCKNLLAGKADLSIGMCKECYPAHSSPYCKRGLCSEGLMPQVEALPADRMVWPRRSWLPVKRTVVQEAAA